MRRMSLLPKPEFGKLRLLEEKSTDREIILVPGFFSNSFMPYTEWVKNIRKVDKESSVFVFYWDTKNFTEFVLRILMLKNTSLTIGEIVKRIGSPGGFLVSAGVEFFRMWEEAKANTRFYARKLLKEIEKRHKLKQKEIILIGHSLGVRLIYHLLGIADKGMVSKVYMLGGAIGVKVNWRNCAKKVRLITNCYSKNDMVLRILYRIAEIGEMPVGVEKIGKKIPNLKEIDCSRQVDKHTSYFKAVNMWFK